MGKTTGVVFGKVTEMMQDNKQIKNSGKPSLVTIPMTQKVRKNDRIFLLKKRKKNETFQSQT